MDRSVPALTLFAHKYSIHPSFFCSVSRGPVPAGCISQTDLSADLGLVQLPGGKWGEWRKAGLFLLIPLSRSSCYLLCLCMSDSHQIGHHYLSLGSSKPAPHSRVGSSFLRLLIPALFQEYLLLTFTFQSENILSFALFKMLFIVASIQNFDIRLHVSTELYLAVLSDLSTNRHQLSPLIAQTKLWNLHYLDHRLLILFSMLSDPMLCPILLSSSWFPVLCSCSCSRLES